MVRTFRYLPPTVSKARKTATGLALVASGALAVAAMPATAEQDQLSMLPPAGSVPADMTLHYDVMVGGLHATSLQFSLTLDDNGGAEEVYRGEFKAWAEGLLSWIVDFQMTSEINGKLSSSGFHPKQYQALSEWSGNARKVEMVFDDNGSPEVDVVPVPDREPVPDEYRSGKLDPISSLLTLIYGAAADGCNDQVEAYDGRRLYSVVTEAGESVTLPKSSINIYEGPATTCKVSVERAAEVWRGETEGDESDKRYLQDITAYFAPVVEGFPSVPVRLEAMSKYGGARAHLVKIERR